MRRRSWLAVVLTLAVVAVGLRLLLTDRDQGSVPSEQTNSEHGGEPSSPPPTLSSRQPDPHPAPMEVPPIAPAEEPAVRVRVTSNGAPLPGATVSVEHVGPGIEGDLPEAPATGEDGRTAVVLAQGMFPVALVVRGSAGHAPSAVTLSERPTDEVIVDLEAGQPLKVQTIDMDRQPIAGVPVVVFPVGCWAQGNAGMTSGPSGWFFEDSRDATTGADGTVVVHGLDPSRLYRAYAPGYGTPMQIVPPPPVPQPSHDPVAPGPDRSLVLMIAPLRIAWVRVVDAETGDVVSMASVGKFFAPGRMPEEQMRLLQAAPLWLAQAGLLRLPERVLEADYFRTYVWREGGSKPVQTGPLKVRAPGYQGAEVLLPAQPLDRAKPTVVRLVRSPGARFTTLAIVLKTQRERVRAIVQLRRGKRTLCRRGFDSESTTASFTSQVEQGQYELMVGGTSLGSIDVTGTDPIERVVDLDTLPSVQIALDAGGRPYSGTGSVAFSPGPGATAHWMFIHPRIPFVEGRSPHVVVPAGELVVGAGTGDGRHAEYVQPSIADGEQTTVSLSVP